MRRSRIPLGRAAPDRGADRVWSRPARHKRPLGAAQRPIAQGEQLPVPLPRPVLSVPKCLPHTAGQVTGPRRRLGRVLTVSAHDWGGSTTRFWMHPHAKGLIYSSYEQYTSKCAQYRFKKRNLATTLDGWPAPQFHKLSEKIPALRAFELQRRQYWSACGPIPFPRYPKFKFKAIRLSYM